MFEFFNFARNQRLSHASEALQALSEATGLGLVQLQTLQMGELLEQPMDLQNLPPEARPAPVSGIKLDTEAVRLPSISGHPPTGNSESGLSL